MSEKIPEQKIVDLLKRLIRSGTPKQYLLFFEKYHEADIAEILETFNPEEKQKFFLNVKPEIAAEILEEMSMTEQVSLISELKVNLAAKFIEEMDPDDAVDLLEELQESDEHKAEEIIEALPQEEAKELKTLLSYEEDTAGAIMTSEYVALPENRERDNAERLLIHSGAEE